MPKAIFLVPLFILQSCDLPTTPAVPVELTTAPRTIGDIPPPPGSTRVAVAKGSFAEWLRGIRLRKDNHVYLYNGLLKQNQSAQFAVLDISVGNKDLQQCADAVMRIRAEFLFYTKRFEEIRFTDNGGKAYEWNGRDDRVKFDRYLEGVFGACGTASLEKQLRPIPDILKMETGDVFIKGGFPGHAMQIVDMAVDGKGKKFFMLAQSYMPAQDIHIVKNSIAMDLSPWYELNENDEIITPEWTFYKKQLRRWSLVSEIW